MPAATIREIPLPARVAFSSVNLLGSNSVGESRVGVLHRFEREGDVAPLSLEVDRDLGSAPLRAALSDRPRDAPIEEVLDNGVTGLIGSLVDLVVLSYEDFVDDPDGSLGDAVSDVSFWFDSLISSVPRLRSILELEPEASVGVLEPEDKPCPTASFTSFF
jgi:hypothetical protein